MDKVKKFVKDHPRDIVLVSAAIIATRVVSNRQHERNINEEMDKMNKALQDAFRSMRGDFRTEAGGWFCPVIGSE